MLTLTHNIQEIERALDEIAKSQVPQATAWALNDTAYDGLKALQEEMVKVFDRPVRFTLNAFMVWRADKRTLKAVVKERPDVGPRHYLKVQGTGGTRPSTGVEGLLRARYGGDIVTAIPAGGAKRDAHGNWSPGERQQALSGIGAQRDARSNTTAASSKRSRAKKRAEYFVPKPGSNLSPGIYRRERGSGDLEKVLTFSSKPATYSKRIDYHEVVQRKTREVYASHFDAALKKAIRTAK